MNEIMAKVMVFICFVRVCELMAHPLLMLLSIWQPYNIGGGRSHGRKRERERGFKKNNPDRPTYRPTDRWGKKSSPLPPYFSAIAPICYWKQPTNFGGKQL